MDETTKVINITLKEYTELKEVETNYINLVNALTDSASLNYNKNGLTFDSVELNAIFRAICGGAYNATLSDLKDAEKGANNDYNEH